jgi:hypothetical protein
MSLNMVTTVIPLALAPTSAPSTAGAAAGQFSEFLQVPNHWPMQGDLLTWSQQMSPGTAAMLVVAGLIYLLFGWHVFKILVTINATIVGAYVGAYVGSKGGQMMAGGLIGALVAAGLTWPMMKWAVAVMGGIFGAIVGASIWQSFGLEPKFAWAGGLSGLIFFGMLSFIVFRGSVMTYMSLQGSVMLVFGVLGLVYKYQSIAPQLTSGLTTRSFILPAAIFLPAMFGLIYQQHAYGQAPPASGGKK